MATTDSKVEMQSTLFAGGNTGGNYLPQIDSAYLDVAGLEHLSYNSFFQRYIDSSYGTWHATQQVRYANRYPYNEARMFEDLGNDIDPVEHMRHTFQTITRPLVKAQVEQGGSPSLDKRDISVLFIGTLVHDIGECTHPELAKLEKDGFRLVGDKAYGSKEEATTDRMSDEECERHIRRHIINKIWPELDTELLGDIDEMIENPQSRLGDVFKTIEILGYFETGLSAARTIVKESRVNWGTLPQEEALRVTRLAQLGAQVANPRADFKKPYGNHYQELRKKVEDFPYVKEVVERSSYDVNMLVLGRVARLKTEAESIFPDLVVEK